MSIQEFNELNYEQKIQATRYAVCIGSRTERLHTILLYQYHSFYIEVFFHKRYNYICAINGFDNLELLDPYLEKMEISLSY